MLQIDVADALTWLKGLPDEYCQMCVTSPPYYALRDYGIDGQLGLEKTPAEYLSRMVAVFHELRRVLRQDGTLWLNMGDSYSTSSYGSGGGWAKDNEKYNHGKPHAQFDTFKPKLNIPAKNLLGMPWRLAFALQDDGWFLRQDIIWQKPNPMPESVRDRCTKAHEYLFLLAKSSKYYFDADAIREPCKEPWRSTGNAEKQGTKKTEGMLAGVNNGFGLHNIIKREYNPLGRNRRSVWTIPTKPFKGAHFATFPTKLVEPCILAGTSEKGCCSKCGKCWQRIIERTKYDSKAANRETLDLSRGDRETIPVSGTSYNNYKAAHPDKFLGWKPSCDCSADLEPCLVIDPFAGAGTVGVVCRQFGRSFHGCELNPAYAEMARKRLSAELHNV